MGPERVQECPDRRDLPEHPVRQVRQVHLVHPVGQVHRFARFDDGLFDLQDIDLRHEPLARIVHQSEPARSDEPDEGAVAASVFGPEATLDEGRVAIDLNRAQDDLDKIETDIAPDAFELIGDLALTKRDK